MPPTNPETPCAVPRVEDARWFAEEVHAHDSQLKSYLRGSFPSVRDIDDVVQESYLRVWRARDAAPLRSARAFLFTVARRLALDWLRQERRSPLLAAGTGGDPDVVDDGPGVARVVGAREKIEMLSDALLALPPRCRAVVMLYKLKGLSRSDVARRLDIAEKTVDEQAARGVRRLEEYFQVRGVDRVFEP